MHQPQSQPITSSEPSDLSTDTQSVQAVSTDKRNSVEHCYICAPSCVITLGEQQGEASVSLNLNNLVKQLSRCTASPWFLAVALGHLAACVVSRLRLT